MMILLEQAEEDPEAMFADLKKKKKKKSKPIEEVKCTVWMMEYR